MASIQEPIRFATFNASLNRNSEGELITDLSTKNNSQAQNIAEIIQRSNPDVVLINEFDFDSNGTAAQLFQENYLSKSQNGASPVDYSYRYVAASNTGIASGFDLDNNGTTVTNPDDPGYGNDAFGFGNFSGQFGMALYSKYPIDTNNIRTFQNFLWKDMPGALLPDDPNTPTANDWYSPAELEAVRLSSKSHWDVPINVDGKIIHALVSHPTPPVFDGDEDRNGKRNHDEIRFWSDYITPGQGNYIYDDDGKVGNLTSGASFVIMGDQNADPFDGDSTNNAILQLLDNELINTSATPTSAGGIQQAQLQGGVNDAHIGNPEFDTADFAEPPGNLRVDYVLPSNNLEITNAAVFWPQNSDRLFDLVGTFDPNLPGGFPSSDHRLVWTDILATSPTPQTTVVNVDFLGQATFPTGSVIEGTQLGGLSGITYDPSKGVYYSISDDRSQLNPARFYTLDIDLSQGNLSNQSVKFTDVTTLLNANGQPFAPTSLDPEAIRLTDDGTIFISSEGDVAASPQVNPFVNEFSLAGEQLRELPVPQKFLPTTGDRGIRNNLAFESLAITPNQKFLYTATENALTQDGAIATPENGSPSRILKYSLVTGNPVAEFLYITDPVAAPPIPADQFSTNGLVELLALDNSGTLLALERSFSVGVGNNIKLYEVRLQGATDISGFNSVDGLEVEAVAQKRLLLDFDQLGVPLDNIEGITLGETLPDGRQSLVVVSDNNFSPTQVTQLLAFAVDTKTIPEVSPTVETPPVIDLDDPPKNQQPGDADDPAIYVHPTDAAKSLVIGTLKDGGLSVYDLNGKVTQTISPGEPGEVRYNNVDLVYNFNLGGQNVDLAIASDRENDTLAIFKIDPTTRQLTNVTDNNITTSIFGVDDGEQTAYGLTSYTSPVSGKSYVFVSQREGNQVAQLELVDDGGEVSTKLVRSLTVPIPAGGVEDAQVEGMVADRELGYLYVGQEKGGIFKFSAEPSGGNTGNLIETVKPDGSNLAADVEGLTIYYAADGKGYLLASSQGDSTYAVFTRAGNNNYLGNFAIGASGGVDSVEESDGADVINVPLGAEFPSGLLVVQDGSNDPAVVVNDDGEIANVSSNFKFVPWQNVANAFPNPLEIDTTSFNPRDPLFNTVNGTDDADNLTGSFRSDRINGLQGDDTITGLLSNDRLTGGGDNDTFVINRGDGIDTITDYGGIGTGSRPTLDAIVQADTIKFQGEELIAKNMLLTQTESDLVISFENVNDTQVILNNFNLENLDNLNSKGNILFNEQNQIQDSFDVFNADWQQQQIFNRDSVTFLNDLDNTTKGFNDSQDVINGQSGNDKLSGLSGNDLLRGDTGNDTLLGGKGSDRLWGGNDDDLLNGGNGNDTLQGGVGQDQLIGGKGSDLFVLSASQGVDIITDFKISQADRIGLTDGLTFEQLAIAQDIGSNANNTLISVFGENIAIITDLQASSLDSNNFILT